jgi:hypothetical protein
MGRLLSGNRVIIVSVYICIGDIVKLSNKNSNNNKKYKETNII